MSYVSRVAKLIQNLKELNVIKEKDTFSFYLYPSCGGGKDCFTITFSFNRDMNNDDDYEEYEYDRRTLILTFREEFNEELADYQNDHEIELTLNSEKCN